MAFSYKVLEKNFRASQRSLYDARLEIKRLVTENNKLRERLETIKQNAEVKDDCTIKDEM